LCDGTNSFVLVVLKVLTVHKETQIKRYMGSSDSRALARATEELKDAGDPSKALPVLPLEKQGGLCGEALCGPTPWTARLCGDGKTEGVCMFLCRARACARACVSGCMMCLRACIFVLVDTSIPEKRVVLRCVVRQTHTHTHTHIAPPLPLPSNLYTVQTTAPAVMDYRARNPRP
jgi:hypothetical protein